MSGLVIDASAALALSLKDESGSFPDTLMEAISTSSLMAPSHWWIEVANGFLVAERRKRIRSHEISEQMELLAALEVEIIPITPNVLIDTVMPLATKHGLTVYDACYLYLAIRDALQLATLDKALVKAAQKEGVEILG